MSVNINIHDVTRVDDVYGKQGKTGGWVELNFNTQPIYKKDLVVNSAVTLYVEDLERTLEQLIEKCNRALLKLRDDQDE
jgi:hypothetical protein